MAIVKLMRDRCQVPNELADTIAATLAQNARGADDRLLPVLDFFEGELRVIEVALRFYDALDAEEWEAVSRRVIQSSPRNNAGDRGSK